MKWKWHWYCYEEKLMRIGRLHKFQWQAKFAGRLHSIFHGHAYGNEEPAIDDTPPAPPVVNPKRRMYNALSRDEE